MSLIEPGLVIANPGDFYVMWIREEVVNTKLPCDRVHVPTKRTRAPANRGHDKGPVLTSLRAVASSVGPVPNDGHHRASSRLVRRACLTSVIPEGAASATVRA
jgi:hypothetical protein